MIGRIGQAGVRGRQPGRWRARIVLAALALALMMAGGAVAPSLALAASVPGVPANVTATATSTSTMHVTWSAASGATSYVVSNGNTSVSVAAGTTSYNWTGLAPGTYMCLTVAAKNSAGQSAWSPYSCTTTPVPTPANVTATATSYYTIHVAWTNVSGASFVVSNGNTSVTVAAGTTSYDWGSLDPGTYMCFTVAAKEGNGQSPWSAYACATTMVPTPTNITATATSSANIRITWKDAAPGASFTVTNGAPNSSGQAAVGANSLDWGDLTPGTYMCFTVAAKEGNGQSPWSAYACATTPQGDPWDQPSDWFGHLNASNPSDLGDPINVIITGTSTVSMSALTNGLNSLPGPTFYNVITGAADTNQQWTPVAAATSVNLSPNCMNILQAAVDPAPLGAYLPQDVSERQGGCTTDYDSGMDHFRAWQQSTSGAYFIAASTEYFCAGAALPPVTHCIQDYNYGRDELVNNIETVANNNNWPVSVNYVTEYPSGNRPQLDGTDPTYDGQVAVITLG